MLNDDGMERECGIFDEKWFVVIHQTVWEYIMSYNFLGRKLQKDMSQV